jgi:hypothetical protein
MTQELSKILVQQVKEKKSQYDLRTDAPIFEFLHPKLIEAQLQYSDSSQQEYFGQEIHGWFVYPFPSKQAAKSSLSETCLTIRCLPFEVFQMLKIDTKGPILMEADSLGAVILSKIELSLNLSSGIHQKLLPLWIEYILSPELWAQHGKWPRFHQTLHTLFYKHQLLDKQDAPGFYSLKPGAQKLENFGFFGSLQNENYTLTLPWTFPLTALQKLEQVMHQEF